MTIDPLSQGFIRRHPEAAARVLERLAPDISAGLLSDLKRELATSLLAAMVVPAAADRLAVMAPEQAAELLDSAAPEEAANLLHAMPAAAARACLERLPVAKQRRLARMMGYPQGSVGSRMKSQLLVLPDGLTAAEALKRVRQARQQRLHHLYLTDQNQRLTGVLELDRLVRADGRQPLTLLKRRLPAIPVRAALNEVAAMALWRHHQRLPVVDNKGRLVGEIDFADLQHEIAAPTASEADETRSLLEWIWQFMAYLLNAAVELLFVNPPTRRRNGNGE